LVLGYEVLRLPWELKIDEEERIKNANEEADKLLEDIKEIDLDEDETEQNKQETTEKADFYNKS